MSARNGFKYDAVRRMWVAEKVAGTLDYSHDWKLWLAAGDSLQSSVWTVDSNELTIVTQAIDGKESVVWLQGGVVGRTYKVTNSIVTVMGRSTKRVFEIRVVEHLSG